MKFIDWTPFRDIDLSTDGVRLFKKIKAAGLPIETIVPRKNGDLRFNFSDDVTIPQMLESLTIARQYDANIDEENEVAELAARLNDLRAVRRAEALLAEIEADTAAVQGATLADLRQIVRQGLTRERQIVRALMRVADAMMGQSE